MTTDNPILCGLMSICFFFSSRRLHTMCGRDWSSDVCSSDLRATRDRRRGAAGRSQARHRPAFRRRSRVGTTGTSTPKAIGARRAGSGPITAKSWSTRPRFLVRRIAAEGASRRGSPSERRRKVARHDLRLLRPQQPGGLAPPRTMLAGAACARPSSGAVPPRCASTSREASLRRATDASAAMSPGGWGSNSSGTPSVDAGSRDRCRPMSWSRRPLGRSPGSNADAAGPGPAGTRGTTTARTRSTSTTTSGEKSPWIMHARTSRTTSGGRRTGDVTAPVTVNPTDSQFTPTGRTASPGSVRSPASTRLSLDLGRTCQRGLRYAALMSKAAPTLHLTAVVTREGDWYVARCLEIEAVSQGETVEQALANLRDVVEVYLEEEGAPPSSGQASPLVTSFDVPIPA